MLPRLPAMDGYGIVGNSDTQALDNTVNTFFQLCHAVYESSPEAIICCFCPVAFFLVYLVKSLLCNDIFKPSMAHNCATYWECFLFYLFIFLGTI